MASIDRTAYPRFSHQLSDQELDARYGPTDEETTRPWRRVSAPALG